MLSRHCRREETKTRREVPERGMKSTRTSLISNFASAFFSDFDMDGSVHREIGRHKANHHKADNSQWMVPQQLKFMSITTERDNAIHERNIALAEKRTALAERDMAILQKDTAIAERNRAIVERDSAIASLEYVRENVLNFTNGSIRSQRCPSPQVNVKHQNQQEHVPQVDSPPRLADAPYDHDRMLHIADAYPISAKPQHSKRSRTGMKAHGVPVKKATKSRKCQESKKGNATLHGESRGQESIGIGGNLNKDVTLPKKVWNTEVSGLNQVTFDETTMPLPGCSCTGTLHQCYKWGNGGWQSSCCTTTMSMYPLPMVPSKGRGRIGGRKMSGSAFNKLLSRLAQQGYDLSMPLDLKNHWAKHGTNRYITIK